MWSHAHRPQQVLTAAHCVRDRVPGTIDFSGRLGADPALTVPVADCAIHPTYNDSVRAAGVPVRTAFRGLPDLGERCNAFESLGAGLTFGIDAAHDVAVLTLARPLPGTDAGVSLDPALDPSPRWDRVVAIDSLVAVGYGSGRREFLEVADRDLDGATIGTPGGIERGDSGGPLLARTAAGLRVVGVASTQVDWTNVTTPNTSDWIAGQIDGDADSQPDLFCGGRASSWDPSLPGALDTDRDGIADAVDSCLGTFNPCQDPRDLDGDGVPDECDACPVDGSLAPEFDSLEDADGDGAPDVCDCQVDVFEDRDADRDADLVPFACDNCSATFNPDQSDSDSDERGDACDSCPELEDDGFDRDGDGLQDACDNCDRVFNPSQANCNLDAELLPPRLASLDPGDGLPGIGDACDATPCGETALGNQRTEGLVDGRPGVVVATRLVEVDGRSTDPQQARTGFRYCPCDVPATSADPDSAAVRVQCELAANGGCVRDDRNAYDLAVGGAPETASFWRFSSIDDLDTVSVEGPNAEVETDYAFDPEEPGFVHSYQGRWDLEADLDRWVALFGDVPPSDAVVASVPGVLWTHTPGPVGAAEPFGEDLRQRTHHYWSGAVTRREAPRDLPPCVRHVGPLIPASGCALCTAAFPLPFLGRSFADGLCVGVPGPPLLALPELPLAAIDVLPFDPGPLFALAGPDTRWVSAAEPLGGSPRPPEGPQLALLDIGGSALGVVRQTEQGLFLEGLPDPCQGQDCVPFPLARTASAGDDDESVSVLSGRRDLLWTLEGDSRTAEGRISLRSLADGGARTRAATLGRVLAATYDAVRDALYVLDEVDRRRGRRRMVRLVRFDPLVEEREPEILGRWPRLGWTSRFTLGPDQDGALWLFASGEWGPHVVLRLGPRVGRGRARGLPRWRATGFAIGSGVLADVPVRLSDRGASYVTEDWWGRQSVRGLTRDELDPPRRAQVGRCF